ncbi:c-type cytochrome [Magnetospira sp. QH-2]|uniref:c-type cytochrome n=1 Tax=Magnetospira sp. (strain QH-2) TaxID=1288970 RepID=UPI0003E80F27|nr:c-type cytochrome [Magnetospira sp. QH-2]CCQ74286.1 Putative cytochrome c4 [Magnetospira sp. QH-2]
MRRGIGTTFLLIVFLVGLSPAPAKSENDDLEAAVDLSPDVENGQALYDLCAPCHGADAQGSKSGLIPQLAGQHRRVLIHQLEEFRTRIRPSEDMEGITNRGAIGGPQDVADLVGYIETLPLSKKPRLGPGFDLAWGRALYQMHCETCHGETGDGNADQGIPRIHGQHYPYLIKQLLAFRDRVRTTPTLKMVIRIKALSEEELSTIADYIARLE